MKTATLIGSLAASSCGHTASIFSTPDIPPIKLHAQKGGSVVVKLDSVGLTPEIRNKARIAADNGQGLSLTFEIKIDPSGNTNLHSLVRLPLMLLRGEPGWFGARNFDRYLDSRKLNEFQKITVSLEDYRPEEIYHLKELHFSPPHANSFEVRNFQFEERQ